MSGETHGSRCPRCSLRHGTVIDTSIRAGHHYDECECLVCGLVWTERSTVPTLVTLSTTP